MERPVERPKLELEWTFSFSRYHFFYDSRSIEDDKGVIAFDVGTREDEHRPRFYVEVKVMKDFVTVGLDDAVGGTQQLGNVSSCAYPLFNSGKVAVLNFLTIVSTDEGAGTERQGQHY